MQCVALRSIQYPSKTKREINCYIFGGKFLVGHSLFSNSRSIRNKRVVINAVLVVLLLNVLPLQSALAALYFTNRTTADGLGHNTVRGVYASGSTVYAATANGLSISTDSGATFNNHRFIPSSYVDDVYKSGTITYAATDYGLVISTDDFATYTKRTTTDGLGHNTVREVYASGSTVYAATFNGLSISTDGGVTFSNRTTSNGLGSNNILGVYVDGTTVYAATYNGAVNLNGWRRHIRQPHYLKRPWQ